MSNRKSYNSIVFLTVYLGLVLVGASPQVLAQAAMTRQFDIKTEIVVEDDLDKKPDDENVDFAGLLGDYFDDVQNLVRDLEKYHRNEKFDLSADSFDWSGEHNVPCNVDGDPVRQNTVSRRIENKWLDSVLNESSVNFGGLENLADCVKNSSGSKIKFYYDNAELKIEISASKSSKQRAEFSAQQLARESAIYEIDEANPLVKTIHQNTSFQSENDQVFIVTRLPRGSIDDLFNEKDAQ